MNIIATRLNDLKSRIHCSEQQYGRPAGSVQLLVVSKTQPADKIRAAAAAGQQDFGENYLQDAVSKINELNNPGLIWHFIGPVQSNKTRPIAEYFSWVHTVDRVKIARRLSDMRPDGLPDLNICIQVNISGEQTKSGITEDQLPELAAAISCMPRLVLRGLMTMPAQTDEFGQQRASFRRLYCCYKQLQDQGYQLDTLSMGTSDDLEAAIAEGSTCLRIGSAVFGPRAG